MRKTLQWRDLGLSMITCLESLKMEWLNERVSNLDEIYEMSIINIISFDIFVLSLNTLINLSAKIQALE